MALKKAYHVVVIGDGITGLSTSFFLKKKSVKRLAISQKLPARPTSAIGSGFCSGGQLDNFTRISHQFGIKTGRDLWQFGNTAFDSLAQFTTQYGIVHQQAKRTRFLVSPSEVDEAQKAIKMLAEHGFSGEMREPPPALFGPRTLAYQDDGCRGGFIDTQSLFEQLHRLTRSIPRIPTVKAISFKGKVLNLLLSNGLSIEAEIVILACHFGVAELVPELAPILIPYADQWSEFTFKDPILGDFWVPGTAFTCNNTHEWGVLKDSRRLHLGGARYLRPLAGVEAKYAWVEPKVTNHLKSNIGSTLGLLQKSEVITQATYAFRDIRPCDELPLIGPMFGEPRMLIATGFSGLGYQTPFFAGLCLADLVAEGIAPGLPRVLWPERLRTLSDSH